MISIAQHTQQQQSDSGELPDDLREEDVQNPERNAVQTTHGESDLQDGEESTSAKKVVAQILPTSAETASSLDQPQVAIITRKGPKTGKNIGQKHENAHPTGALKPPARESVPKLKGRKVASFGPQVPEGDAKDSQAFHSERYKQKSFLFSLLPSLKIWMVLLLALILAGLLLLLKQKQGEDQQKPFPLVVIPEEKNPPQALPEGQISAGESTHGAPASESPSPSLEQTLPEQAGDATLQPSEMAAAAESPPPPTLVETVSDDALAETKQADTIQPEDFLLKEIYYYPSAQSGEETKAAYIGDWVYQEGEELVCFKNGQRLSCTVAIIREDQVVIRYKKQEVVIKEAPAPSQ